MNQTKHDILNSTHNQSVDPTLTKYTPKRSHVNDDQIFGKMES
jgi:hypothetical protein